MSSRKAKTAPHLPTEEAPKESGERLVFLGDALNDAAIAKEIRALVEKKRNPLLSASARTKIEARMSELKEQHGGNFINVEDTSSITNRGKNRLLVKINNCWNEDTGQPYQMRVHIEDWYNFGKPFAHETSRKKVMSKAGFEAFANYTRILVKPTSNK